MRFLEYLEDKRYFLIFYIALIVFVTLMMFVTSDGDNQISNILYTNLGCTILAAIYLIGGYFYRNDFYKQLKGLTKIDHQRTFNLVFPKPQNHAQKFFITGFEKLQKEYMKELEHLHNERKDYQDFIMSWIHEVKLPITASRMLMKNSTDKTLGYVIDKLEDELNKIDHYVEQALYYSRIGSFSKDYFITEVSLNQIVKESVKKYSKLFIQKHIQLTIWDEEEFVQSDSKWLGFVIDQVVANALKYTEDGGAISFAFRSNNKEKQLFIKDTGIGIKPEDINRVFEKGFTGSLQRNHSKSTGMGLYLAKQIALKLGHNLSIQSEEGKYTQVTIHFPKISSYYFLES